MLESYSDGLEKGQLDPLSDTAEMDTCLAMMADVQNGRISAAQPGEQDAFIFYTNIERAQVLRAAGRLEEAIDILNSIPQPAMDEEQDFRARILCFTQTELHLRDSLLGWDDVELAMALCDGQGTPQMMITSGVHAATTEEGSQPRLQPNPATTEVLVQGYTDEDCILRIMDITGRAVVEEVRFNTTTTVPLQGIRPGTYVCRITTRTGRSWIGRLVVGL